MATKKEYDFNPYNLPQELMVAIGLVTANAAQTESVIEWAIAGCLGVDTEYGAAATTHMPMPLRFSILRSVAEIRIDDLDALDELDDLLEQAEKAYDKRNQTVHHPWCRDPISNNLFRYKETSRQRYVIDLVPVTVDQVKADALFIYKAGMDLMSFLLARKLIPPPTPVRPRWHKSKAERKKRRKK